MRQLFSSPRLENVEAVAELLRAEGIEVRISNDRSYRGKRRSNFSYRDAGKPGPQPAVWIVNSEDQPRGRQLLREAGLLESSRSGESSYLPLPALDGGGARSAVPGSVRFGHPSGTLRVGAEAQRVNGQWAVTKALMSRSARVLMEGHIRVPAGSF